MTQTLKSMIKNTEDESLVLTPMINDWLMHHSNDPIDPKIMDRVMGVMTIPPRIRSRSFSASAAGNCPRRQELAFIGAAEKPHYPALRNTFLDGHFRHRRWQIMLLSANLLEDIEVPLEWPKYHSKGSADGRGYIWWETADPKWQGKEFIWEHKGVGSRMWDTLSKNPKEDHIKQVHRYMLVSGIHTTIITYEDKGNHEGVGWKEFVIEADPLLLEESRDELESLNDAYLKKNLHPIKPGCKLKTGSEYLYCPFGGKNGPCLTTTEWPDEA